MMISNKRGFTLIELLVVVLIIGVLAAVALPQYQTAVNKSRYAGLMPLAKSVKDAEEEVFMTKADYTADLGDLAVAPGNIDENNTSTATQGNVTLSVVAGASEGQDYVKAVDNRNADNTFIMYFARSPKYAGEIHCEAKTNNAKAQQLCKSYGPVGTVTNGADTTGSFTTYVLQGTGQNAEQSGGSSLTKSLSGSVEPTCGQEEWGVNCPGGRRTYDDESYVEYSISCYDDSCSETSENPNYFQWTVHTTDGKTISFTSDEFNTMGVSSLSMGEEYSSLLGQTASVSYGVEPQSGGLAMSWTADNGDYIWVYDGGIAAEIHTNGTYDQWYGDPGDLGDFVGSDVAASFASLYTNTNSTIQEALCSYDPANPRCS